MNAIIYMTLSYVLGCIFGMICIAYIHKYKTIHGIIVVDDENESYFFKLSSDEIKNTKNSYITFKIERGKDSQK